MIGFSYDSSKRQNKTVEENGHENRAFKLDMRNVCNFSSCALQSCYLNGGSCLTTRRKHSFEDDDGGHGERHSLGGL